MDGRTHIIWSVAIGILVGGIYHASLLGVIVLMLVSIIGGVLPDIDHPKSFLGHWFVAVNYGAKHRGFMHSVWVILLLALLLIKAFSSAAQIAPSLTPIIALSGAIAFLGSYVLHLLLDSITPAGIKPLYPFSFGAMRGPIPSSGIAAFAILLAGISLCAIGIWVYVIL